MAEPKGGLVYVAGDTEEAKAANQAYQDALQKLTASLEARQNRFFDPTLLAIAEGMLGPTRTGSFSEALGRSAEKLRQSQEEELKQEQQIAQARLGLAERGITLAQQRQRQQDYAQELQRLGYPAPAARQQTSEDQRVVASPVPMTRESRVPGLTVTTDEIDARKELPQRQIAAAAGIAPPLGFENSRSLQIAPPNIAYVDPREHLLMRGREGKMSIADARKEVHEMQKDRYVFRDNAIFDKATGRVYYNPTGDVVEVSTSRGPQKVPKEIVRMSIELGSRDPVEAYVANLPTTAELAGREAGARAGAERGQAFKEEIVQLPLQSGGTGGFPLGPEDAFRFQQIRREHGINSPQALAFAARFTGEQAPAGALPGVRPEGGPLTPARPSAPPAEVPAVPPRVAAEAPPAAPPPALPRQPAASPEAASPEATPEPRQRVRSESERAAEAAAKEEFAKTLAKLAAEKEANLPQAEMSAREMRSLVDRVFANLSPSSEFVGLLSRPGIGPAVAKILAEGITTERGSWKLTGIEEALLRTSGATKQDIQNIEKIRADLSQAELLFTQLYLAKQGAITEGERRIVRQLGASTEQSADAIRTRMALIKDRADFDKDTIASYRQWKQRNQDRSFADYQTTPEFAKKLSEYERKTATLADQNLIERGRRYQFGGKTYEYVGPENDRRAARMRENYREVQ